MTEKCPKLKYKLVTGGKFCVCKITNNICVEYNNFKKCPLNKIIIKLRTTRLSAFVEVERMMEYLEFKKGQKHNIPIPKEAHIEQWKELKQLIAKAKEGK